MKITVTNLTLIAISTDAGLLPPKKSRTIEASPDQAYKMAENLKSLVDRGAVSVTIGEEPEKLDLLEQVLKTGDTLSGDLVLHPPSLGSIKLGGDDIQNTQNYSGGQLRIQGIGSSLPEAAGGVLDIYGGRGAPGTISQTPGNGGEVRLQGGYAGTYNGFGGGNGGPANISGGSGVGAAPGGDVAISSGDGGNPNEGTGNPGGSGGNISITANHGGIGTTTTVSGDGGNIIISAGVAGTNAGGGTGLAGGIAIFGATGAPGGDVSLSGGGGKNGTSGGNIDIRGGSDVVGVGSVAGGNIIIFAGQAGPTGVGGNVYIDANQNALGGGKGSVIIGNDGETAGVTLGDGTNNILLNGRVQAQAGDSTGTPGNATIDASAGKSAIALGGSSATITNSLATVNSLVFITPLDLDATLVSYKAIATANSFTITGNTTATAIWKFQWLLIN